ncbi:MAG: peptide chain release factor N(5)-glutamine methyltransferase [Puniceicoccales bacterium]|jgi:release factor glutamine methyltransferase|nr:peptide chain release factor N(5)-glutamine methyltransferase [Puniceicoccales bacterium]
MSPGGGKSGEEDGKNRRKERSLAELLADGEEQLRRAGVENPDVDARWLMADALGCPRTELALHLREPLADNCRKTWENGLARRRRRVPLQHILKKMPFAGVILAVDSRALIPRPETEELVELLVERLRTDPPRQILDLGTGSGACILALGTAFPHAALTACDRDRRALALARANGIRCGLAGRVRWRQSDWFSRLGGTWDLIVANPPYLSQKEWERCADEVRLFDPFHALVSEDDGLADGKRILADGVRFLRPGGLLAMEMGAGQGSQLRDFALDQGWGEVRVLRDLGGRDRFLLAAVPDEGRP